MALRTSKRRAALGGSPSMPFARLWKRLCFIATAQSKHCVEGSKNGAGTVQLAERHAAVTKPTFLPFPQPGKRLCFSAPWHAALSRHVTLCVGWNVPAPLLDPFHAKCKKPATTLLCEVEQQRDFLPPIARRATKVLGPVSKHRIAQVLPVIRCASRSTRPGSAVGIFRVMCDGLCTSRRFHVDDDDDGCTLGCREQADCLRHYNQCPRLAAILQFLEERRCSLTSRASLARPHHANSLPRCSAWDFSAECY